jgi:hypothetical protein
MLKAAPDGGGLFVQKGLYLDMRSLYKTRHFLLVLLTVLTVSAIPFTDFPQAEISNGLVTVRIYLPDAEKGYYRSTRFDWAGVIPDMEYKGHTYFGNWFGRYDPTTNDAIMGPVEAFTPLGYETTAPGGSFVQIGVGVLAKESNAAWQFYKYYKILNHGQWKVNTKPDAVEFTQTLDDSAYSYEYKKTVSLTRDKPQLVLTHALKNTGHRAIVTNVFDHNFFVLDGQTTGPDADVSFPFNLTPAPNNGVLRGIDTLISLKANKVFFLKKPDQREYVYTLLQGFGNSAKDYDIKIENHHTGAAVRISSDRAMTKLMFWANPMVYCAEPYIPISISPGETFTWKIYYDLYTCAVK